MSDTQIIAEPGTQQIVVSREFDAPRDLVFRAYTDPELLVQWMGPRRLTTAVDTLDVRDGGKWRYTHTEEDGTVHGFHGVFHGTPSPDGIVQTFEYEGAPGHVSLETLSLGERDGRTLVRSVSVFGSVEARDAMVESGMEVGVVEGNDRLAELLARLLPVS